MWSEPVTFGGGMEMTYEGLGSSGEAAKADFSSQPFISRSSTS
jgi:hypothetical protein